MAGTGLLGVVDAKGFRFDAFIYEHDVNHLSHSGTLVCKLRAFPSREFESSIRAMVPVDVKHIENVGITLADVGYIPVKPSPDGRNEPLVTLYVVRSARLTDEAAIRWGLTGKARITYGAGPMGSYHFQRIVRGLRLRLQAVSS
jgi:hypothetical protein